MKSLILYSQPDASFDHVLVMTKDGRHKIFVRAEIVYEDSVHALDKAKPRAGETVLNSVEIQ